MNNDANIVFNLQKDHQRIFCGLIGDQNLGSLRGMLITRLDLNFDDDSDMSLLHLEAPKYFFRHLDLNFDHPPRFEILVTHLDLDWSTHICLCFGDDLLYLPFISLVCGFSPSLSSFYNLSSHHQSNGRCVSNHAQHYDNH